MQPSPPDARRQPERNSFLRPEKGAVGLVSTSGTALQQVAYLLAREGVGVSEAMKVVLDQRKREAAGPSMLQALEYLQSDPDTEVITLVAWSQASDRIQAVLDQVRDSDKPTIVCLLGTDQRLIWQAGAIPAGRLDEAAMRAAAWVRGWDQALVSSRLEDQYERLAAAGGDLKARVGPGRHGLSGLFSSQAFYTEAQLALAHPCTEDSTNSEPRMKLLLTRSEPEKLALLRSALGDPKLAVVLLDTILSVEHTSQPGGLLVAVDQAQAGPAIITHICGTASDLQNATAQQARLRAAGIVVAPSNAAAAYLAGSLIGRLT